MARSRREEFLLDVRRAVQFSQRTAVEMAGGPPRGAGDVPGDAIARMVERSVLWLTPRVVENYAADDFVSWSPEQQARLR